MSAPSGQSVADAQAPQGVVVRPHSPVLGPKAAPVTIIEFFDPACEACRAMYPEVKKVLAENPRTTRLVLKYVPFHGHISVTTIGILEASRRQGKFEQVLDALMEDQPKWATHGRLNAEAAWAVAARAGLDTARAQRFLSENPVEGLIAQDHADAKAAAIRGTPTFYVNGKPLMSLSPAALREAVSRCLPDGKCTR
ncbi:MULTISPECIES: DsbA family protein [Stenotrophomonas]|uniref:DsbA family protein n=1 Tax=Stenotrophomonas TaxID=40323 RepID=UPI00038F6788|nr:thioredoxin domain-containing protein [Stenotrophomonas maltophilia]EQM88092.1 hypothetical protein L681_00860 [Stenotrophomonas maltophilia MF89]OHY71872.1 hypothetical protein BB780_00225 [Stenotrophomonas maltophilia]